jgi:hypothetical protein
MRNFAAALVFAWMVAPAGADPVADACGRDNGKTISACEKMCTPACRAGAFAAQSEGTLAACRILLSHPENRRVDAPECAQRVKLPPDPCDASVVPTGNDGIPESGTPPPQCLRSFRHLQCRFERIGERVADLNLRFKPMVDRYKPLLEKGDGKADPEKLLCNVTMEKMAADYKFSEALNEEVEGIKAKFSEDSTCLRDTEQWINNYQCNDVPSCGDLLNTIVHRFKDRIKPSLDKRGQVETLFASVQQARRVIVSIRNLHRAVCEPVKP